MSPTHCTRLIVAAAVLLVPLAAFASPPEEQAVQSAEDWLALVDSGEYAKSWDAAASYFRDAVTKDQWKQAVGAARRPFGEVRSRKIKSKQFATSLPGAPDGEYVVIQFQTSFEKKAEAVETITPMKDTDGKWRVAGYFVR